ncbi:glycosyltransferase family 39 protein [Acidobacteriota bacterium]
MIKNTAPRRLLLFILILAFVLRIVWIFMFPDIDVGLRGDGKYYDLKAQNILQGKGYSGNNNFAFRPPGYALFLASIYSVFGHNLLAVKIIQAIISILTCLIIFAFSKILFNRTVALFSAALFAFYPLFIRYSAEFWTETLFIFLFFLSLFFLVKGSDKPSCSYEILSGIFLGLAALTREVALLYTIPIGIWLYICSPRPGRLKYVFKKFGVLTAFLLLTIMPWTIRNYIVFQKFVPISTNGGINFYIGNNPIANGKYMPELDPYTKWPAENYEKDTEVLIQTELTRHTEGYKKGIEFVRQNPSKFIKLAKRKFDVLWKVPFHDMNTKITIGETIFRLIWIIIYIFILITLIPSIFFSAKTFGRRASLLYFILIIGTGIHMITFSTIRFRLPYIPLLMILASVTIDQIVKLIKLRHLKTQSE